MDKLEEALEKVRKRQLYGPRFPEDEDD